jgi:CheY-like chemotaxis protein
VHELATNAAKYGALSTPGGHVRIDWQTDPREGETLVLHWRETGGPTVSAPTRRGFGIGLIRNSLSYELGGTVEIGFPAEGLTCTVAVPWDQIVSLRALLAPAAATAAPTRSLLKGARVLVVEDNALVAMGLVECLEDFGALAVGPAPRLAEAVRLAQTAEIDVAMLDIDLDGTMVWPAAEVLSRRGIPFCFATGFMASLAMPAQLHDRPMLNKPFTLDELEATLKQLLSGPREAFTPPA